MPTEQKKNDMLLNVISNPTYTTLDFMDVGLDETNTSILPYETYRNNEEIQKAFTVDGKFDEQKLKDAYNIANSMLYEMAETDMNKQIAKEFEFQPGSLFALSFENPKYDTSISDTTIETEYGENGLPLNPDRKKMGIAGIGKVTEGKYSMRELAQMSQTYNSETGEWEESPEEWFGQHWFENIFNPRVYATYSEYDPEVQRGEKQVGEWKIGPNGTYYTERLNGNPVYDKQVVSFFDTLTKEDSWLNRYDFFDSDDKEKSVAGSLFKNLAMVVPALVGGPVAAAYLGVSTGLQAMKLMTGLGKILAGSDVGWLNNMDGFLKQFDMSVSDHSQESAWTMENFLGLGSQVYLQLAQQRYLFENVPKLFGYKQGMNPDKIAELSKQMKEKHLSEIMKKTKDPDFVLREIGPTGMGMKSFVDQYVYTKTLHDITTYQKGAQRIGEILSKGYMTGITTIDSYDAAKKEGAEDWQAALLALGYSVGEYRLLSTGIGEMVMPELRANRRMVKKAVEKVMGITDEAKKNGTMFTKEGKNKLFQRIMKIGNDVASGKYHGQQTAKAILANGLGEGVEEMSEELLYDFVKSINNGLAMLTDGAFKPLTAWDDVRDRYAMSFIGGALGGSVFNAAANFKSIQEIESMNNEQAQQYLLYKIREGKRDEIEKALDKMTFGPRNMKEVKTDDNNGTLQYVPGNAFENQDKLIKDEFRHIMDNYEIMLKREGFNISDSKLFNEILPDYRYAFIDKSFAAAIHMNDFQNALSNLTNAYKNYDAVKKSQLGATDSAKKEDSPIPDVDKAVENAQLAVDKARAEVQSYINGEKAMNFILKGVFEAEPNLNIGNKFANLGNYSLYRNGKTLSELSEDESKATIEEYAAYLETSGKDRLNTDYEQFMAMLKVVNPKLSEVIMNNYARMQKNASVLQVIDQQRKSLIDFRREVDKASKEGNTSLVDQYIRNLASGNNLSMNEEGTGVDGLDSGGYYYGNVTEAEIKDLPEDEKKRIRLQREFNLPYQMYFNRNAMRRLGLTEEEFEKLDTKELNKRYAESFNTNDASGNLDEELTAINRKQYERQLLNNYILNYINNSVNTLRNVANYDGPLNEDVKKHALQMIASIRSLMEIKNKDSVIDEDAFSNMASNVGYVLDDYSDIKSKLTGISEADPIIKIIEDLEQLVPDYSSFETDEDGRAYDFNPNTVGGVDGFMSGYMDEIVTGIDGTKTSKSTYRKANINAAITGLNSSIARIKELVSVLTSISNEDKKKINDTLDGIKTGLTNIKDTANKIKSTPLFNNNDTLNELVDIESKISSKETTPIYELLDNFQIDEKRTKATDVIKNMENKLAAASTSPQSFVITDSEMEQLDNLENEIHHIIAAIYASSEDTSSSTNPFGFVNSYNALMKDTEGFNPMNLLKRKDAEPMTKELYEIIRKIQVYRKISSVNSENKLNENPKIEMNKAVLSYDAIADFVNKMSTIDKDKVSKIQALLDEVETKELIDKYRSLRNNNRSMKPTDEDLKKAIRKIMDIEQAFHDAMVGNDGKPVDDALLTKVIDMYDPFVASIDTLNDQTKSFDANTKLWYLTSLIASDPSSVSYAIMNAYKSLIGIAPTAQQVMSLKGLVSYMTGRDAYSRMSTLFKESILRKAESLIDKGKEGAKELFNKLSAMRLASPELKKIYDEYDDLKTNRLDEYNALKKKVLFFAANSKSFNIFDNMYWIGGIPGSGKTMGVAVTAIRALTAKDDGGIDVIQGGRAAVKDGIMVVSKEGVARNLSDNIKSHIGDDVDDVPIMDFEKFLERHFAISSRADFLKEENVGVDTTSGGDFTLHSKVGTKTEDMPKILLIDEGTLLNQVEMDAINLLAAETGTLVIVFGDEDQMKQADSVPNVKDQNGIEYSSPDYIYAISESQFPHAPKIGSSMRTNNVQKDANMVTIKVAKEDVASTGKTPEFTLHYSHDNNGVYGEELVEKLDDSTLALKRMMDDVRKQREINPDNYEKIGVVASKATDRSLAYLKSLPDADSYFDFFDSPIQTQGLERKYYIYIDETVLDDTLSNIGKNVFMDGLYTVTSRSKQYTLIVNSGKYNDHIKFVEDEKTAITQYDRSAIQSYNKKYTTMLDEIFKDKVKNGWKATQLKLQTKTAPKKSLPVPGGNPLASSVPADPKVDMDDTDKSSEKAEPVESDKEDGDIANKLDIRFDNNSTKTDAGSMPMRTDGGLPAPPVGSEIDKTKGLVDKSDEDIKDANEQDLTKLFGSDPGYGVGVVYTHTVDTIGIGVMIDRFFKRIMLNGFDSSGLNGIGKIIGLYEKIAGINEENSMLGKLDSESNMFTVNFDNESDIDNFIKLAHAYLIDTHVLMVAGTDSEHRSIVNKINAIKERTKTFLKSVHKSVNEDAVNETVDKLFGGILDYYFVKTDTVESNPKVPFQYNANLEEVFDSRMNKVQDDHGNELTARIPRARLSAVFSYDGYIVLSIPLFNFENPFSKIRQNDFEDVIDWANKVADGNISANADTKTIADFILYLNSGEDTSVSKSVKLHDDIGRVLMLSYNPHNEFITGEKYKNVPNKIELLLRLYRVYDLYGGNSMKLDKTTVEHALETAKVSGPAMRYRDAGDFYAANREYQYIRKPDNLDEMDSEGILGMSDIMILQKDKNVGGNTIKAGIPFIITGYGTNLSNSGNALTEYLNQFTTGIDKGLRLYYVNNPRIPIDQFFEKLKNIITSDGGKLSERDKLIGNVYTAYRLLEKIYTDDKGVFSMSSDLRGDQQMIVPEEMGSSDNISKIHEFAKWLIEKGSNLSGKDFYEFVFNNSPYINMALLKLAYNMELSGRIKLDDSIDSKLITALENKGIGYVFLNAAKSGKSWSNVNGINYSTVATSSRNRFSIEIDGESYPFTVFGKIESPILAIQYYDILDQIYKMDFGRFTKDYAKREYYIKRNRSPFKWGLYRDSDGIVEDDSDGDTGAGTGGTDAGGTGTGGTGTGKPKLEITAFNAADNAVAVPPDIIDNFKFDGDENLHIDIINDPDKGNYIVVAQRGGENKVKLYYIPGTITSPDGTVNATPDEIRSVLENTYNKNGSTDLYTSDKIYTFTVRDDSGINVYTRKRENPAEPLTQELQNLSDAINENKDVLKNFVSKSGNSNELVKMVGVSSDKTGFIEKLKKVLVDNPSSKDLEELKNDIIEEMGKPVSFDMSGDDSIVCAVIDGIASYELNSDESKAINNLINIFTNPKSCTR